MLIARELSIATSSRRTSVSMPRVSSTSWILALRTALIRVRFHFLPG